MAIIVAAYVERHRDRSAAAVALALLALLPHFQPPWKSRAATQKLA